MAGDQRSLPRHGARLLARGCGQDGGFCHPSGGLAGSLPEELALPHTSVNYLCYHDGFTLEDLVSYNQRHNQANGEDNRDGHGNNLSSNHGVEGPTLDPRINNLRQQQKRNLIATLLLSQGTPHFLAGDEMGRSQLGNNNAYCQDNQISWVNWQLRPEDERLLAFTRQMMALRAESGVFSNLQLSDDGWNGKATSCHQVNWYHPDGHQLTDQDWHAPMGQAFAMDIGMIGCTGERWYVLFNASDYDIQFRLPPPGRAWSGSRPSTPPPTTACPSCRTTSSGRWRWGVPTPSSCWSGSPCRRRCWRVKGWWQRMLSPCCQRDHSSRWRVEPGALTGYAGHRYQW